MTRRRIARSNDSSASTRKADFCIWKLIWLLFIGFISVISYSEESGRNNNDQTYKTGLSVFPVTIATAAAASDRNIINSRPISPPQFAFRGGALFGGWSSSSSDTNKNDEDDDEDDDVNGQVDDETAGEDDDNDEEEDDIEDDKHQKAPTTNEESQETTTRKTNSTTTIKDETSMSDSSSSNKKRIPSLSAPFQMNMDIQEEASNVVEQQEEEDFDSDKELVVTSKSDDENGIRNNSKTSQLVAVGDDDDDDATTKELSSDESSLSEEKTVVGKNSTTLVSKLWWGTISQQLAELNENSDNDDEEEEEEIAEEGDDSAISTGKERSEEEEDVETTVVEVVVEEETIGDETSTQSKLTPQKEEEKTPSKKRRSNNRKMTIEEEDSKSIMKTEKVDETDDKSGTDEGKVEETDDNDYDGRSYVSTGLWIPIDNLLTAGLSSQIPALRASQKLRAVRKYTAKVTGLHGVLSGKPSSSSSDGKVTKAGDTSASIQTTTDEDKEMMDKSGNIDGRERRKGGGKLFGIFGRDGDDDRRKDDEENNDEYDGLSAEEIREVQRKKEARIRIEQEEEERRRIELDIKRKEMHETAKRMERVREIDRLISEGQDRLQELICEKDVLQKRPNPLFDYTASEIKSDDTNDKEEKKNNADENIDFLNSSNQKSQKDDEQPLIEAVRIFKFPPDELVEEYLDMMFWTRRLNKMNHSDLWKDDPTADDEEDETLGDDLFTPSADAHILYERRGGGNNNRRRHRDRKQGRKKKTGGGGSWLLRQSLFTGPSFGEKIGEVAETAAYKAVCGSLMSGLARSLSGLHGVNVMKHSDIRLVLENAPDLPPIGSDGVIPGSSSANYAQETIQRMMKEKTRKLKKKSRRRGNTADDGFVQRDAVTELLLSHVQISAPLLKLFPLAWQRALLGNILTLSTALISDFLDGLEFQILGHRLKMSFTPITEMDMIHHLRLSQSGGVYSNNNRRARPEEFEAAVAATAEDLADELKFLDRWHERALGSGVLRSQIANLIARIVLTLTDEILSGARMDLFTTQAGGPRIVAGLEYRVNANTNYNAI